MALERPLVRLRDRAEALRWFTEHQHDSDAVFIAIGTKGGSVPTPTYDELVELALIHGWIDGQVGRLDDDCYRQAFSPRRARSPWSQINRRKAEALIAAGKMTPAGLAAVEVAKANGRWDTAYAGQSDFELPADFLESLAANPTAEAFFATLNRANHFAVYFRITDAKRPETRARRIAAFVEQFERGEPLH
ncbi:YdeI family protein [Allobranchiibius sp. CTAmp26]|uniref:YdeI/OmpD-associated family protein n=1 Tax=Allobranchiibius sp. CTAmp26 TaxID=2815214 RepID=UPI001AA170F0|nr:YdeI/OmpD-associated family protein [Allobranchiibius sp. CTAmp26]MBO1756752.1 YdeI/OmpD-associated family protein [Allobranchiibius sp. CTAmp26]